MNFLAHLHLAHRCNSHLAGNLLADFVRGDPFKQYPEKVAQGIKLHRFIDSYIDTLPEVLQCRQLFSNDTRRVSGIALDIAWDHFLARHWQRYSTQHLEDFVSLAEKEVQSFQYRLPESYRQMMQRMWQQQWLLLYRDKASIEQVLFRMAQRRPKLIKLANCPEQIFQHYDELQTCFHQIYPQLITAAQSYSQKKRAE